MAELALEVGDRGERDDALVVETITRHAPALLRTARRYSACADDAHDAYQRALEIFVMRAGRLRRETAVNWLHQVVKNEALAVREARRRLVATEDVEPDGHVATPEERVVAIDRTQRAAEALARLKPQEAQALWLKAQGLSYHEIAERQAWSYTKVNRCLTEGRKAFLERFAGLESGDECRRWAPVVSALVDGEISLRDARDLRRHLRHCGACRSTVRELRAAGPSLAGVLPGAAVAGGGSDTLQRAGGLAARVYEALAGGLHERVVEAASAGKVAAVAASAAAIATGGAVTAQLTGVLDRPARATAPHRAQTARHAAPRRHRARPAAPPVRTATSRPSPRPANSPRALTAHARRVVTAREFGFEKKPGPAVARAASAGPRSTPPARSRPASNPSSEFGFEAAP
jgi:RNA polymerase sigma factor (sigma-70 family)